ncbi:hypothetical protein JQ621_24495 [Bradyrhizobium manausense]|uniref:hypothetical protein n=1 Tax=Bradyrhizobium manausense TaxID=989370 RepID=UPI001BA96950|nr:hypothetical protein [Bradyrhizobium manausense]MBR1090638.1 hypothetical protein [Bradyrhizobium manausense]
MLGFSRFGTISQPLLYLAAVFLLLNSTSAVFGQFMIGGDRGDRPMDGPRGGGMHDRAIGEGVGLGIGLGLEIGNAVSKQGAEDNAKKKTGDGSATVTKSPEVKKPKRAAKKGDDAPAPVHPPKAPDQPATTAGPPPSSNPDTPQTGSNPPSNPPPQTTSRSDPPTPQDPKDVPKPPVDPQDIAWECDEPICVGGPSRKDVAGMLHDGCVRTEKVLSLLELPGSIEDNLNKASGPARLYLDFFSGKDGPSNRETLKGWLIKIKDACKQKVALICEKCDAKTLRIGYSYTNGGSGILGTLNTMVHDSKIHLCVPQWCNAKGQTPRGQAGSLLHELSHLVGTDDMTGKAGEKTEFTAQGLTEKLIPTLSDAYDKLAPSTSGAASASATPPPASK